MERNGRERNGGLLGAQDVVLVFIDIQERLFKVMDDRERVESNAVKLAAFSKIMEIPVLVTEQQNLGNTLGSIRRELPGERPFSKLSFSCFGEDAFCRALRACGRRTLLLAGIEAHICVLQTALEALPDFRVQVVCDAVTSRDPRNSEIAVMRMVQQGVVPTTTETVMYEVMRRAGTDTFREVLELVR